MSTVACAGCGMPRAAELVESTGCPVCGHLVSAEPTFDPPREWASVELPPEPIRVAPVASRSGGRALSGVVGFVGGVAVGIVGMLAWQGRFTPAAPVETESRPPTDQTVLPTPAAVVPPRELSPVVPEPATPTAPPEPPTPAAVPVVTNVGKTMVIELDEPTGTYTLAVPMLKGEHVVLKGKVGTLRLASVEAGSTLDATQLEADAILLTGRIDGGAKVQLNAPFGTVNVAGKIDGGAKVTIAGRVIVLSSGVGGTNTQVKAVIGRGGSLRVADVQGTAVVEYVAASSGWSQPDVVVGAVARGAAFRKAEEK